MKRKLTNNELSILKSLYFNEVSYDEVIITSNHYFSKLIKGYSGIVFDNTIVFTTKSYKDDFSKTTSDMSLLVHEMCHIWQYQNLNYRWYRSGIEHIKFGKSTYLYDISEHKKLTDFRFEQQGEIMADYFRKKIYLSSDISVYEDVIYSTIKKV